MFWKRRANVLAGECAGGVGAGCTEVRGGVGAGCTEVRGGVGAGEC